MPEPGGVAGTGDPDVTWYETTPRAGADTATYEIGPVRAQDPTALGPLHCRIWQVTYGDLMSRAWLDRLTPEGFTRNWQRRVDTLTEEGGLPHGEQVLIARRGAEPVGFISTGRPRDADPPVDWQLWALNVAPEHQGTGLAQRMIDVALGDRDAYLWVAQGNDRAIRFYRRQGFTEDGVTSDRDDGMVEVRMVRH